MPVRASRQAAFTWAITYYAMQVGNSFSSASFFVAYLLIHKFEMEHDEQVIGAKIEAAGGKPIEWCDLDFLRLASMISMHLYFLCCRIVADRSRCSQIAPPPYCGCKPSLQW